MFDLSESEYVDCSRSYNNQGCNGGWYFWAWDYHKAKNGLATEAEYPYAPVDNNCKANYNVRHAPIVSYTRYAPDSETI